MNYAALLSELRAIVTNPADRIDALQHIANLIRSVGNYRWVGLYDVNHETETVKNIVYSGPAAPEYPTFSITKGLTGAAIRTLTTINVGDVSSDSRYLTAFGSTQSEIIVPILDSKEKRVVGTIDIESEDRNAFDAETERMLEECSKQISSLWSDRITPKPGARIEALRQQIWPRPDIEAVLTAHLERQYGGAVVKIERLDAGGVYAIEWASGSHWIARLFPALRPTTAVEGDAEVLRFLASHEFPAERCAHDEPVSSLEDRRVLVTERLQGSNGREARGVRLFRKLGELLGVLHTLPANHGAMTRPAGSWHHLSLQGGSRSQDIAQLSMLLADAREIASPEAQDSYEALRVRVGELDNCEDLPQSLTHPDFSTPNVIISPKRGPLIVDWTGAGRGPRILALGTLLSCAGGDMKFVDAIVAGYSQYVRLESDEIARLPDAVRGFGLIVDAWTAVFMPKTLGRIVRGRLGKWYVANAVASRAQQVLRSSL